MIVIIMTLTVLGLSGVVLTKSCLDWFPKRAQKVFHWIRMRIFWGFPLRMMIQQYIGITLAALLNLKYQDVQDTVEQSVNRAMSICILIFYSFAFIVFIYVFVRRNGAYLSHHEMRRRFDSIYMSLELEKYWALPYYAFSLLRKCMLIFVPVFVEINIM